MKNMSNESQNKSGESGSLGNVELREALIAK